MHLARSPELAVIRTIRATSILFQLCTVVPCCAYFCVHVIFSRSSKAWLHWRICLLAGRPAMLMTIAVLQMNRSGHILGMECQIVILLESGLWLGNSGLAIWNSVRASKSPLNSPSTFRRTQVPIRFCLC